MNALDRGLLEFLNRFAGRWPALDQTVKQVALGDLYKGAVTVAVLWGLWFLGDARRPEGRRKLATGVTAVLVGLAFNRALAALLPFRPRPLRDPSMDFHPPHGMHPDLFSTVSAFPSDHAVMFLGLAAVAWSVSRRAGAALFVHALVVVLLPRLYLGLHHPSDMLAGAALGLGAAWLGLRRRPRALIGGAAETWARRHAPSFYGLMALLAYLMATLFDDLVQAALLIRRLAG